MTSLPIIVRQLLTASLLAGLTTAGLPPCLLAPANCRSSTANHGQKTCCCEGKCGGHCHMACCQSPPPDQQRGPAPTRVSDDGAAAWGLAATAAARLDAATAAGFRHDLAFRGAWIVPGSLLDLSIRLNV